MSQRDPTAAARVSRYKGRNLADGLVRVTVWVPGDRAGEVRRLAIRLRKRSKTPN